jgi:hypothetical protein
VFEIQGELKKIYMGDENAEDWEYSLQKHFVINYSEDKQFVLHSEELKDGINYRVLHWDAVPGRGQGRGMVEEGFQSQTWSNDSIIKENEIMELASKIVFTTTDDLLYDNVLTDADNGTIIKLDNGDFKQVNTVSNSIPQFGNQRDSWKEQFVNTTSTHPGITGEQQPANTPLGSVQIQNAESRSIFDYRREQMGIFLEDMIEEWVLPHLLKDINKEHILNSDFTVEELDMLDTAFSTHRANEIAIEKTLDGKVFTTVDFEEEVNRVKDELLKGKDRRYLQVDEGFFENLQTKVRIVTTNEKYNKQAVLQSLVQLLTLAPTIKEQPELIPIFSRAIEMSGIGISPVDIVPRLEREIIQNPAVADEGTSNTPSPAQTGAFAGALEETAGAV